QSAPFLAQSCSVEWRVSNGRRKLSSRPLQTVEDLVHAIETRVPVEQTLVLEACRDLIHQLPAATRDIRKSSEHPDRRSMERNHSRDIDAVAECALEQEVLGQFPLRRVT